MTANIDLMKVTIYTDEEFQTPSERQQNSVMINTQYGYIK